MTTRSYPNRVGTTVLSKIIAAFRGAYQGPPLHTISSDLTFAYRPVTAVFEQFYDPKQGDQLTRIQKDLEDTQEILEKALEDLLERGEKLDDLLQSSQDMSATSKQFVRQANSMNGCCSLL